jgi:hypothetical protein
MNIAGKLIALEEQFCKGDADFYRQRLTTEARATIFIGS